MSKAADHYWLRGRLVSRAKDARQAEQTALKMWLTAYPDAQMLAKVHGDAAAVYERAILELDTPSAE